MADGRSLCSSDADADHGLETESVLLAQSMPESCELELIFILMTESWYG